MQQSEQKLRGSQAGKGTAERRKRLIPLLEATLQFQAFPPKQELSHTKFSQEAPAVPSGAKPRSPKDEIPTLKQKGPSAVPRVGWQLAEEQDNEKILKRRSFCAAFKKEN